MLRQFGKVDIPQEAFIAALKMDSDSGLAIARCLVRRRSRATILPQSSLLSRRDAAYPVAVHTIAVGGARMCNCCQACHAKGASAAKNLAATEIGVVLGNVPIDGSTPNERFACAITLVQTMFVLTQNEALGWARSRHLDPQRSTFRSKRSSRR